MACRQLGFREGKNHAILSNVRNIEEDFPGARCGESCFDRGENTVFCDGTEPQLTECQVVRTHECDQNAGIICRK